MVNRPRAHLYIDYYRCYSYFTSSKLTTTDYQQLMKFVVQIRNVISILDIIPK